jgi:hypothetical protein
MEFLMKQLIVLGFLASMVVPAFADPPKTEEVLVTIPHANVCYKANVLRQVRAQNREVIDSISSQVPCDGKPAKLLTITKITKGKEGDKCGYTVIRTLGASGNPHESNTHLFFYVIARCPTDQK